MPAEESRTNAGDTAARRSYFFAPGCVFAPVGVAGAGCAGARAAGWLASVPPAVAPGCFGLAGGCCAVPPAGGWAVPAPGCGSPTLVGGGDSGAPALFCVGARAVFLTPGSLRQLAEPSNIAATNNVNPIFRLMETPPKQRGLKGLLDDPGDAWRFPAVGTAPT
jgi:hypothetical protein